MEKRYASKKEELIKKSRESMMSAVQIYNNPLITFKTETFLVLSIIAWTYLMHAYYEQTNIEYRYYKKHGKKRIFDKLSNGAYKEWDLSKCISVTECPLSLPIKKNLEFLIGLRNEVEHQMTNVIDKIVSAKLQACALNYNSTLIELFGKKYSVADELAMTIQFAGVDPIKQKSISKMKGLAENVVNYIISFEDNLSDEIIKNTEYSYKVVFLPVNINNKSQADNVIEFTKVDENITQEINERVMVKYGEKNKFLPSQIVKIMQNEGYKNFSMHYHTMLWKNNGNLLKTSQYGYNVANKTWYWYDTWVNYVREHCAKNKEIYGYIEPKENENE